jgi:hypothetical protein
MYSWDFIRHSLDFAQVISRVCLVIPIIFNLKPNPLCSSIECTRDKSRFGRYLECGLEWLFHCMTQSKITMRFIWRRNHTTICRAKKEKNKLQHGCFLENVSMYGSRTPELLQQLARLLYDQCLCVWLWTKSWEFLTKSYKWLTKSQECLIKLKNGR